MKCPYCGEEMKEGCVGPERGMRLAWTTEPPGLEAKGLRYLLTATKMRLLGWPTYPAHLCETCKKVILDYDRTV